VTRQQYLDQVIRIYLAAPGAPHKPTRRDWAIAAALYRLRVTISELEHSIRLANLRRLLSGPDPLPPIRSLAYYRTVLQELTPDERDPDYVRYVRQRHRQLSHHPSSKTAPKPPESRAL